MRYIISILIFYFILSFFSCSDKYQSLVDAAPAPSISFDKDTLYLREKDYFNINGTNQGVMKIASNASDHQLNLQLSDSSGKVHFEINGGRIGNLQPMPLVKDTFSIYCSCDTAGIYPVNFYLSDPLGKITRKILMVNCAANRKAVPSFSYSITDPTFENWQYRIDASASSKSDGIIAYYHFTINGYSFVSNTPVIYWYFHAKGKAVVSLFVTDDLNLHSDTLTKTILIP